MSTSQNNCCRRNDTSNARTPINNVENHMQNPRNVTNSVVHYKYLNYPPIVVLKRKDISFLIIINNVILKLLGFKNDHVIRNNVSVSSKFKPNDIFEKHNHPEDVWLLDKIGLKQLISTTNNPKIHQFKQWIKREILGDEYEIQTDNNVINPTKRSASTQTANIYTKCNCNNDDANKLYLIQLNNKLKLVDFVHDHDSIKVLFSWRRISPHNRRKITHIHEDVINIMYNNSNNLGNIVAFISDIIYDDNV